jgi:hypothetical protein
VSRSKVGERIGRLADQDMVRWNGSSRTGGGPALTGKAAASSGLIGSFERGLPMAARCSIDVRVRRTVEERCD